MRRIELGGSMKIAALVFDKLTLLEAARGTLTTVVRDALGHD